jgi:hypothetical protein
MVMRHDSWGFTALVDHMSLYPGNCDGEVSFYARDFK